MKHLSMIALGLVCLLGLTQSAWTLQDAYPFANDKQQQRFYQLLSQLRCLVCQNQTLAESDVPLAKELRQQVATQIQQGESDQQIHQYLQARYGEFVLYRPRLTLQTGLLWLGPFGLLIVGLIALIYIVRQKHPQATPPLAAAKHAELLTRINALQPKE